jgi:hypothetical protein
VHGVIIVNLERFVEERFGRDAWYQILEHAQVKTKIYLAISDYPDKEAVAILTAAEAVSGQALASLLDEFGAFLVPVLLSRYRWLIRSEWKTLDLLENTESVIHSAVHKGGGHPPRIDCKRLSPNLLELTYSSKRQLCGLIPGLIRGIAEHYRERVSLQHPRCMLRSDKVCLFLVRYDP